MRQFSAITFTKEFQNIARLLDIWRLTSDRGLISSTYQIMLNV